MCTLYIGLIKYLYLLYKKIRLMLDRVDFTTLSKAGLTNFYNHDLRLLPTMCADLFVHLETLYCFQGVQNLKM